MSTVQLHPSRFVIDASADAKVNEIAGEFADVILEMAAKITPNRTRNGTPSIDVCDIEAAAHQLCNAIQVAVESGSMPPGSEAVLHHLQDVCKAFSHECKQSQSHATAGT